MFTQWVMSYYAWCHSIEIFGDSMHMYFIPSLIVLAVILVGGGIHWRNQKKREKEGEEAAEASTAAGAASATAERS